MPPTSLKPGDRVVDLAGLVASAAVAAGSVTGTWAVWLLRRSWLGTAAGFLAGAILGFLVAQLVARILYRAAGGRRTVVKVGRASLRATIPAGLAGGLAAALVVGLVALVLFGTTSQALPLFGIAIGFGLLLGILLACSNSLL